MSGSPLGTRLLALYHRLFEQYGPQHWWPAASDFEMIVGAYLTQNTAWRNVELALDNLRRVGGLSEAGIRALPLEDLQQHVRPSGFFRQKAERIKRFVGMLDADFNGHLTELLALPTEALRVRLLALPGLGRETADCVLLYAARRPVFVIDLYTRRLLAHETLLADAMSADYDHLRRQMEAALTPLISEDSARTEVFNEFHALIVQYGKQAPRTQRLRPRKLR